MLPDNHKIAPYFQNGINVAPNKGAAKALLASVYMTEAGWPLKKERNIMIRRLQSIKKSLKRRYVWLYIRIGHTYID